MGLQVATKFPADAPKHRPDLCRYITQNEVRIAADGMSYLRELLERDIVVAAVLHRYSIVLDFLDVSSQFFFM